MADLKGKWRVMRDIGGRFIATHPFRPGIRLEARNRHGMYRDKTSKLTRYDSLNNPIIRLGIEAFYGINSHLHSKEK